MTSGIQPLQRLSLKLSKMKCFEDPQRHLEGTDMADSLISPDLSGFEVPRRESRSEINYEAAPNASNQPNSFFSDPLGVNRTLRIHFCHSRGRSPPVFSTSASPDRVEYAVVLTSFCKSISKHIIFDHFRLNRCRGCTPEVMGFRTD